MARSTPAARSLHTSEPIRAADSKAEVTIEDLEADGLITRFQDLATRGLIDETVVNTITKEMKLETMTPVQSQTINEAVQGVDTLALARTGTGKTVAFLLPVIQRILNNSPAYQRRTSKSPIDIQSIIISPTRELAEQIAKEAIRMTQDTGIKVQIAVGGTGKGKALENMRRQGCQILVATPGRLHDLLSDGDSRVETTNVNSLVLDEADRLLDEGFGPDVERIYKYLPSKLEKDRQTLMFSATMEREVMGMVGKFMKKDYRMVQTIAAGEEQTHEKVPQKAVKIHGMENQMPALLELIKREASADENFKAIIFFNTSAEASLAKEVYDTSNLGRKLKIPPWQMHARLSQNVRTKTAQAFRTAKTGLLFSSDVSARGMDFPGVTHVIQMGVPKDRDTYIHRVGRTGRAGREGEAWLFVSSWDVNSYTSKLRKLPIKEDTSLETAQLDMSQSLSISQASADILTDAIQSSRAIDFDLKSKAYRSNLSLGATVKKEVIVSSLNRWAKYGWGMDTPPSISPMLAKKIGFAKVEGLTLGEDARSTQPMNGGRDARENRNAGRPARNDRRPARGGGMYPKRDRDDRDDDRSSAPRGRRNGRGGARLQEID